ncbi:hypothetical protein MPER_06979 [Moniliophthora perniciosa FA553]|nr:hypothetical protein MPER_06979 [Moniliophthora perniciosa FA553]
MQFQGLTALIALVLPAITLATPVPGGHPASGHPGSPNPPPSNNNQGGFNGCGNSGTAYCSNDSILGFLLGGGGCNNGNVFCCTNNNQQTGQININEGNCVQQNSLIGADTLQPVTDLIGSLLGGGGRGGY